MKPIRFGTDGWRGVIADDFTFTRVGMVCQAIGEYFRAEGVAERGVAIGYDNRFAGVEFARLAATMLTRQGIRVRLAGASVPTPVISYITRYDIMGGGVVITASHNPARYSGVKIKPWFGGSASPELTQAVEAHANALLEADFDVDAVRALGPNPALLTEEDFVPAFVRHVLGFVNTEAIRARAPRVIFDALYGAGTGVVDRALREAGCVVEPLHTEVNPGFGGLHPEPIAENLRDLFAAVRATTVDGAVASDGDGDRLAAVAEDGTYLSPHHVFALLLMHLVEDLGQRGGVVKTVSTTTMITKLAQQYDLPLYETPIGFKYIGQLMMEEDILIGGEESGGIGFRGHIPERDATLAALLLVQMMAMRHTTFAGLLAQLRERVGAQAYDRSDLQLRAPVTAEQLAALRASIPAALAGCAVTDVSQKDGVKIWLEDASWLLLRPSGTEPLLRVYAESSDLETVRALLETGISLVAGAGIERA